MLKRLTETTQISFKFNGETLVAQPGDSIAGALLTHGKTSLRVATVSKTPRGPFCMMGACYECLVELEGRTVQACMTPVTEGMTVQRKNHESV
ncbi:hypothetical protein AB833_18890 [Chromatiales bacterium (ex Bugula neritina AB1)]|nr:hypothetical protein AB833_18890 [Chromatiales bacterium (ex Bugula neritina AB1)]